MTGTYDAIVIGAGPAGCGVTRLLAAWGHRVLLIDRPGDPGRHRAESIPPSTHKALAALGMLTSIEDARFPSWLGNTVCWADEPPRVERFPPGSAGYHVRRDRFDARLRALAVESGAEVLTGIVRDVVVPGVTSSTEPQKETPRQDAPPHEAGPAVYVEHDGAVRSITAAFVVDASGRSGVVARHGLRRIDPLRRTVAVVATWQKADGWAGIDPAHTLVASYGDGWAWSVPVEPTVRQVTVMVDPRRTPLARDSAARGVYLEQLEHVHAFRGVLEGATLVDGPWGADATGYSAARYAGPGFVLAGDAGSSIDPLSSFGVKKALASGWLAAIAVHTCLVDATMADQAIAFFDRRERQLQTAAERQAAQYAAEVAARTNHPFWIARAAGADAIDPDEADTSALSRDPEVLAAFETLKARTSMQLREGPDLRVGRRAAVRGQRLVLDDHLFLPAWPEGLRYLRNLDLLAIVKLAPQFDDAGALYDAYIRAHGAAALPDVLGALSVLVARGALRLL